MDGACCGPGYASPAQAIKAPRENLLYTIANYTGTAHCIGTGNGLDALVLALRAGGIGPGDEVLVPSNTFIATWLAVSQIQAVPVPVEPDSATHNITAEAVSALQCCGTHDETLRRSGR